MTILIVMALFATLWLLICEQEKCNPDKAHFEWSLGLVENKNKQKKGSMLEIKLTNEQKIKATLTPKTSTGKPAALDGKPTWTVQVGDSTIEVADDGMSAEIISSDTLGDTLIVISADADLGDGVETITDTIKVTVGSAKAQSLGLSLGDPEAK